MGKTNDNCRNSETQTAQHFCGDSNQIPDVSDIEWSENSSEEVFCDDCTALAERINS